MLYKLITDLKNIHSQEKMCIVLKVTRSAYYASLKKKESKTALRHKELTKQVSIVYEKHNKIYGAPKIHETLKKIDIKCSIKLIQKIMKELNIKSIIRKKYKPQISNMTREVIAENLLEQNFKTTKISEKIVGDITYIKTLDYGWCYLASFLDLHTNEIIGWEFSPKMTTDLVLSALNKAVIKQNLSGAIIHTDQGSQYTSKTYTDTILSLEAKLSYSRKGNPYDNACIESFHSILKKESIYALKIRTFQETKESLFKYIEGWYNSRRIQKKLGYLSPLEFSKKHQKSE